MLLSRYSAHLGLKVNQGTTTIFGKPREDQGNPVFFALPRPFAHCLGGQLELRNQVQGMAPLQATLAGGDGAVVGEQIAQDPRLPHLPQQPGAQNLECVFWCVAVAGWLETPKNAGPQ